jgi:hypothetical protein
MKLVNKHLALCVTRIVIAVYKIVFLYFEYYCRRAGTVHEKGSESPYEICGNEVALRRIFVPVLQISSVSISPYIQVSSIPEATDG